MINAMHISGLTLIDNRTESTRLESGYLRRAEGSTASGSMTFFKMIVISPLE
jgi:hypothetical protein